MPNIELLCHFKTHRYVNLTCGGNKINSESDRLTLNFLNGCITINRHKKDDLR